MRKLAHLDADPALVRDMFRNIERWTAWMPGVQSVRVLERDEGGQRVARIRQHWMGRELDQVWSFQFRADGMLQEQVQGRFRRWRADWAFRPAPRGVGTTVTVDLDFDLGILGLLTSHRRLEETLDRMFDEVIDKARGRLRTILAGDTVSIPASARTDEDVVLAVFETPRGLEVRLGGRRYRLRPVDENEGQG